MLNILFYLTLTWILRGYSCWYKIIIIQFLLRIANEIFNECHKVWSQINKQTNKHFHLRKSREFSQHVILISPLHPHHCARIFSHGFPSPLLRFVSRPSLKTFSILVHLVNFHFSTETAIKFATFQVVLFYFFHCILKIHEYCQSVSTSRHNRIISRL